MKREKMNDDNGYHVEKGAFLGESKDAVEELERIRNAICNGEDCVYIWMMTAYIVRETLQKNWTKIE